MAKFTCPIHGPYDASEGDCPICRSQNANPQAPMPLGYQDEMPTDLGNNIGGQGYGYGEDPTELGQGYSSNPISEGMTEIGRVGRDDVTEIDFVDESELGLLWVKQGPRRGQVHRIKDGTVLGRSKGDVLLDDPKASSSHAKFTYEDDKFYIWDFGTRNGTFVNGERIRAATELKENDEIKIGDIVFILKIMN